MRIDPRARRPSASRIALSACPLLLLLAGCRGDRGSSLELTGPEALNRLPSEVAGMLPEDAVLCLDESRPGGAYRIWILRRPGGSWLSFPRKPRGAEQHRMPPSALEAILASRLPSLDRGRPGEPHCRFTHWKLADGAEIQLRELVTDRGWFASVERVAM